MSNTTQIKYVKAIVDNWVSMLGSSVDEILEYETNDPNSGFYKAQQVIFRYFQLTGAFTEINLYQVKEQITDKILVNVFAKDHMQALDFACPKIKNKDARIILTYLQNNTCEIPF